MKRCNYNSNYFDYDDKETKLFECRENAVNNNFCIFHDDKYDNNDETLHQLINKIKTSSNKNEKLFCIGYHIPKITIQESFSKPVYFTKAIFKEKADFSGSKFQHA